MSITDDIKDQHESYGMLGFNRCSYSSPQPLYGSSIKHRDTIMMTLQTSYSKRDLNKEWFFSDKTLFRVEMSSTQFANLITSLNQGDGVPVTIRAFSDGNLVRCEEPPYIDRGEVHKAEFKEHLEDVYATSKKAIPNKTFFIFKMFL